MSEKGSGKPRQPRAPATPEDYPVSSSSAYPSGDYSYTVEVVMRMQATLGQLTEAVKTLQDQTKSLQEQSKDHSRELKEISKDLHAAKVTGKALLWVIGVVGALIGLVLSAYFRKLFGSP